MALLSGGISSEREVSLKSGEQVYEALNKEKYDVIRYDPKTDLQRLVVDAPGIDVALIILHGSYGEDGTVQGMLDLLDIPYQGSGVLGSALAINKLAAKKMYEQAGIPVPPYMVIQQTDDVDLDEYIKKLGLPLVIKPLLGGSSIGMSIATSREELNNAFELAFKYDETILLEKYIDGTELTCGVIGNDTLESLPVVEIIPGKDHAFFNYDAKYTAGEASEICPAGIDDTIADQAKKYGAMAHKALFCKGYSRTDMILSNDELFVLETNTIPGMTPTSLLPLAARTAGYAFDQLLDKLIELALEDHSKRS